MAELQFKARMTKRAFEHKIIEDLGAEGLTASPYVEEGYGNEAPARMTLYYKNGVHCGTWQTGTGWAFKSAYEK